MSARASLRTFHEQAGREPSAPRMRQYIALIHWRADSRFGVSFPDLPGCATEGSTLDEARDRASETLALHLEAMTRHGAPIPAPSSLEEVITDPANLDGVAIHVPAPSRAAKFVQIDITLPEDMLGEI